MIDISNTRIETPRLILRPWQNSDLEDFYAYASSDTDGHRRTHKAVYPL